MKPYRFTPPILKSVLQHVTSFPFYIPSGLARGCQPVFQIGKKKKTTVPFQSFTSFPFLTTIPTQPSPIDLAIGESRQPHDKAVLTRSYTSSIMTTIQTCICHDHANSTFIYVHCIDQNCGYALGHEFSRIPHASSLVVLYEKSNRRPEIIGHLSYIIGHSQDSVEFLIIPSVHFYSNMYKLQPYCYDFSPLP